MYISEWNIILSEKYMKKEDKKKATPTPPKNNKSSYMWAVIKLPNKIFRKKNKEK